MGGIDKGIMYVWYVPVNHAKVLVRTTFRHVLYNSMVRACTIYRPGASTDLGMFRSYEQTEHSEIYSGPGETTYHTPFMGTQRKQKYCLCLRKFVHANFPRAGFEVGSLGPQVGVEPIEPPLLVWFLSKLIEAHFILAKTI